MIIREVAKISIIVPVYNSENFLNQCLNSLVNQTMKSIEIILVNDGSPDNSGKICDEYAKLDERVLVIHQKNKGAAEALNAGTRAASAPYIMYLDADDWLEIDTCEISFKAIISEKLDVVFWNYFRESLKGSTKNISIFNKDTSFDERNITSLRLRFVGLLNNELKNPTKTDAISAGWGKLYRREIISENKIKWNDTQLVGSSDVLFSIQVFQHVSRAKFLNKYLNHYRMDNPYSLTKNYSFSLFGKLKNLYQLIAHHIEHFNLGNEFSLALNNRICLSLINNTLSIVNLNNSVSTKKKVYHLKSILKDPLYDKAINEFNLTYLPLHWKLFYLFAKRKYAWGIYILGNLMNKLR